MKASLRDQLFSEATNDSKRAADCQRQNSWGKLLAAVTYPRGQVCAGQPEVTGDQIRSVVQQLSEPRAWDNGDLIHC